MIHSAFFQNRPMSEIGIDTTTIIIIVVVAVITLIIVSTIPFLLIFRNVFGNLRQTQALLASGEPAQARILKMWDTGTTLNDNPQVGLMLEVYPSNRQPYHVETKCFVSRLRIPQIQPGAVVAVKIDRQDAAKVALELV